MRMVTWLAVALSMGSARGLAQEPSPADTAWVQPREAPIPAARPGFFHQTPFDTIGARQFASRHSHSLDDFLEFLPGYGLARLGPIGAGAGFSRYGMGRARGTVYLAHVPWNDPQSDRAPLPVIPTSAVGMIVEHAGGGRVSPAFSSTEGAIEIIQPEPPAGKPVTAIEVSNGTYGLKQRRARFGSAQGRVGVDLSYDELRNDGYPFDAGGEVGGPEFGRAAARTQGLGVRGALEGGERYEFAFRRYTSDFTGALDNPDTRERRDGHVGLVAASFGAVDLRVYERGHELERRRGEAPPDSVTRNETVGLVINAPFLQAAGRELELGLAYESIDATQTVGGNRSDARLEKASAGLAGSGRLPLGVGAGFGVTLSYLIDRSSEWGGHVSAGRTLGRANRLLVELRRDFRQPNLGELLLPRHLSGAGLTEVEGNDDVRGESLLEGTARWYLRAGVLENELRVSTFWANDPIQPRVVTLSPAPLVRPVNGVSEKVGVVENRSRLSGTLMGTQLAVAAAIEAADGDRDFYFRAVPEVRVNASLSIDRSFFRNTSELFFTCEYQHSGSRLDLEGTELSSYDVLNLRLDARLVDAWLYVLLLNALDRDYETVSPYLMTPRTFVYGVAWTLFD